VALATMTSAPVYCGKCKIIGGVGAHVWWSSVFTTYAATIVYAVDEGTCSTIGSSQTYPNVTTALVDKQNATAYMNKGAVENTTLNNLSDNHL
jgi:hypothetical protein